MNICDDINRGIETYKNNNGKRPRFLILNHDGYLQLYHDVRGELGCDVDSRLPLFHDCIIVVVHGLLNKYTFGESGI